MTGISQNAGVIYRHDTRTSIHEFHVWDMRPASVNQWFDSLSELEQTALESQEHLCCLYFIYGIWPTPYAIKRILDLSRQSPPALMLSSAIVPIGCTEEIIRMLEDTLRQLPAYSDYKRQIFLFAGEAAEWLHERRAARG